jgi:hypothetical protein
LSVRCAIFPPRTKLLEPYKNSPDFLRGLQALKVWALVREDAASITAAEEASLENILPADLEV